MERAIRFPQARLVRGRRSIGAACGQVPDCLTEAGARWRHTASERAGGRRAALYHPEDPGRGAGLKRASGQHSEPRAHRDATRRHIPLGRDGSTRRGRLQGRG